MITRNLVLSLKLLFAIFLLPVAGILTQLQAQLAGYLAANAAIQITPPGFTGALSLAANLAASASAALSAGLTPPSISFCVNATLALIAQLNIQIALLQAMVNLGGSVQFLEYQGATSGLGAAVQGAAAGPSTAFAICLVADATDAVTVGSLKTVFAGASP